MIKIRKQQEAEESARTFLVQIKLVAFSFVTRDQICGLLS